MPRCLNPRCQNDYPPGTFQCINPFCQCLLPQAVVGGRYLIEGLVGLGGMGAVYRVQDTFEEQRVALKVISTLSNSPDLGTAIERFRREARYARELHHRNIVPVLNFGQDGSLLYIVMPLISGGTLKSLLKGEQPLPLPLAQRYLNDLAAAIDAVHAHPRQIVHRDIKPSNMLISQSDGRLLLADFGIARAMQNEPALTQRGWAVGTEHYVAPEQEHGKAEPASDIYSMGVVAYQLFTGLLPFQAVVRSRAAELPTPSALNPLLPQAVDAVVERAMELEPARRFASASEFADALNAAVSAPLLEDMPTVQFTAGNANVMVRNILPERPCSACGQENRSASRFCRRCGHRLDAATAATAEICQVGYVSDVGRRYVALENEDMLLVVQGLCVNLAMPLRPFSLLAVADGLRGPQGKSAGGHEASHLAVETIADMLIPRLTTAPRPTPSTLSAAASTRPTPPPAPVAEGVADALLEQWLRESVRQANSVIFHCNADYDASMASTLTISMVYKRRLWGVRVGDSRAYHYRPGAGIRRVSGDQLQGAALGKANQVALDFFQCAVEADDLILLCTDGLWKMLSDERLGGLLAQGARDDLQRLARALVDAANLAGGEGNISVIVACVKA